jgi:hypothetical protein
MLKMLVAFAQPFDVLVDCQQSDFIFCGNCLEPRLTHVLLSFWTLDPGPCSLFSVAVFGPLHRDENGDSLPVHERAEFEAA